VSINLTIDHNRFDYNGDHGVICSQLCDNLTITNNESDHNGMVPFAGPTGDSDTPGQVHGIMIHRGVTNTLIANNNVHDQPNGGGIAVFDSSGNTITNNTVTGAQYGLRISVGSAANTFSNNTITNSTQYGIFLYQGSDPPSYTTPNGHPTGNIFSNNTFSGSGSNIVKYTSADNNIIKDSTFSNTGGSFLFAMSTGNMLSNLTLPANQRISVTGSAAAPGSVVLDRPKGPISLSLDNSSAEVTNASGQLYTVGSSTTIPTSVTPAGSDTHLTPATNGGTGPVWINPLPVTVLPASGTDTARATGLGTATPHIIVDGHGAGVGLAASLGGLTANSNYTVRRNGIVITTVTADGSGKVQFTDVPPASGTLDYTVTIG
jgi:parallel beta-helix repeat protein